MTGSAGCLRLTARNSSMRCAGFHVIGGTYTDSVAPTTTAAGVKRRVHASQSFVTPVNARA